MKSFVKNIEDPIFATEKQRTQEMWDIEGRLKNANQTFKFDIRPIQPVNNDRSEKIGYFNTQADKIVFEAKDHWIIFDFDLFVHWITRSYCKHSIDTVKVSVRIIVVYEEKRVKSAFD